MIEKALIYIFHEIYVIYLKMFDCTNVIGSYLASMHSFPKHLFYMHK